MTVKEVIAENSKVKKVKINSNDYRKCNLTYDQFVEKYRGTDVWHEHVACYALTRDKADLEIWLLWD